MEYKIIDKILGLPFENRYGRKLLMGSYKTEHNGSQAEHALIYHGNIINPKEAILFRINSACYTSDIFGDCHRCDCNWQFRKSLEKISKEESGLMIYHFHHEGRAFGFTDKIKSLKILESKGESIWDTSIKMHGEIDHRRYNSTILILNDLGIKSVKLMTNNPRKKEILESSNIKVEKIIPLISTDSKLKDYLEIKKKIFGDINDE